MSNHVLIRLIRFVSRFTIYFCNAIYFLITFNTPCKWFIKNLYFTFNTPCKWFKHGLSCPLWLRSGEGQKTGGLAAGRPSWAARLVGGCGGAVEHASIIAVFYSACRAVWNQSFMAGERSVWNLSVLCLWPPTCLSPVRWSRSRWLIALLSLLQW